MAKKFYIKKIVRDDKEQLVFDQTEVYLDHDNTLLVRPEVETSYQDYTEADGGEMIAQKFPSFDQPINGLIVPKTTNYWTLRNQLTNFFKKNHNYFIVYEKISGETFSTGEKFKTGGAWISENLQVVPEPYEKYSRWTVTLRLGTAGLQEYSEDSGGQETYANVVQIPLLTSETGGSQWDETGQVWDGIGQVWSSGSGGIQEVYAESSEKVYPVWEVSGECINPTIRNNETDTEATYSGTIAAGQTLVVDFAAGTALLDGTVVTRNLTGTLELSPGQNLVAFTSDGGSADSSTLSWNNFIS